jgi:hypothetical protein
LVDGRDRHPVAKAQGVAVRRRCFRGRSLADLSDGEPEGNGPDNYRGEDEMASRIRKLILVEKAVRRLGQCPAMSPVGAMRGRSASSSF